MNILSSSINTAPLGTGDYFGNFYQDGHRKKK